MVLTESREPGYLSRYSDWLLAVRQRGRSSSPSRVKNFLLHVVQTGAFHPASCSVGEGGLFARDKAAGA
jgi:hypothetical protein